MYLHVPSRAFASGYGYIVIFGSIAATTHSPAVSGQTDSLMSSNLLDQPAIYTALLPAGGESERPPAPLTTRRSFLVRSLKITYPAWANPR
jgi:hypothetical protein